MISFTAAELAPFASLPIEIYGASRFPGGAVSRTLGFDNWTAGSPPPPPVAMPLVGSNTFAYKYEMDVQPNTQDLDTNSTNDFANNIGPGPPVGGVVSPDFTTTDRSDGVDTGFANSIWREHFLASPAGGDNDWTVETRLKVTTADGTEGSVNGRFGIAIR